MLVPLLNCPEVCHAVHKKTNPAPSSSNVHPLNLAPVRVQPPADWLLEGEFGHMAFEAGEAGRLVRLADVLRWLQSSREIPRSDAVKVLCDRMPADVMGWLYWVREAAFANPVPATFTFGFLTAEEIADRKIKDRQNALQAGLERERQYQRFGARPTMQGGLISLGYPEPTEPGLPALLKYLRAWWVLSKRRGATCDVLNDLKIRYATTLAMRLDKAHALWGYGGPLYGDKGNAEGAKENNLPALVFDALERWDSWASSAQGGYITAVQFLALIFWKLQGNAKSPDDEKLIVEQWATVLRDATHQRARGLQEPLPRRLVAPLNSITRLAVQTKAPDGWEWSLLVSDADNFIAAHDLDLSVTGVLSEWLEGAASATNGAAGQADFVAPMPLPRARGSAWTDDDLKRLLQDFESTPGKTEAAKREALAMRREVAPSTIKKYVAQAKDRAKKAAQPSPFPTVANVKR